MTSVAVSAWLQMLQNCGVKNEMKWIIINNNNQNKATVQLWRSCREAELTQEVVLHRSLCSVDSQKWRVRLSGDLIVRSPCLKSAEQHLEKPGLMQFTRGVFGHTTERTHRLLLNRRVEIFCASGAANIAEIRMDSTVCQHIVDPTGKVRRVWLLQQDRDPKQTSKSSMNYVKTHAETQNQHNVCSQFVSLYSHFPSSCSYFVPSSNHLFILWSEHEVICRKRGWKFRSWSRTERISAAYKRH